LARQALLTYQGRLRRSRIEQIPLHNTDGAAAVLFDFGKCQPKTPLVTFTSPELVHIVAKRAYSLGTHNQSDRASNIPSSDALGGLRAGYPTGADVQLLQATTRARKAVTQSRGTSRNVNNYIH
jgi:hypothetical protein